MSTATEYYFVSRTLRALELLAVRPLSSGELAELIGVHPRTARRLLQRLAHESYAVQLDGARNRYGLTARVVELAARVVLNSASSDSTAGRATPRDVDRLGSR